MTDRKLTCVACKSAVTHGDIEHSDLEFGGEIKATNQPVYTADADTDLVATIGTLDEYSPMVRTTGNQTVGGVKTFTSAIDLSSQYPRIRGKNTDTTGNFQIEMQDKQGVVRSRLLLDDGTQLSGNVHHLIVMGGKYTDTNNVDHDVGLRLSYNEDTSKWVLTLNGVVIIEVAA